MSAIFDFNKQNDLGKQGEQFFQRAYPLVKKLDGFKADFIALNGDLIELKTELRSIQDTPNFFIEYESNSDSLGGPWRSVAHNIKYYVQMYYPSNTFFWFLAKELVSKLENLIENKEIYYCASIYNKKYTTTGYIVKRELLKDIYFKQTF